MLHEWWDFGPIWISPRDGVFDQVHQRRDRLDTPALNKYAIGFYGSLESGIFERAGVSQGADEATFDDPTNPVQTGGFSEIVKQEC